MNEELLNKRMDCRFEWNRPKKVTRKFHEVFAINP